MFEHRVPQRSSLFGIALTVVSLVLILASGGYGAYIQVVPPGFVDRPDRFSVNFTWNFPAANLDDLAGVPLVGPNRNWQIVSINSPAPAGGPPTIRDLTVTAQHFPGANPADPGHGPNPNTGIMSFPNVARPPIGQPSRAVAQRIEHGTHVDYFATLLSVPANGDLGISITGVHLANADLFTASFRNDSAEKLTFTVTPSYRQADGSITMVPCPPLPGKPKPCDGVAPANPNPGTQNPNPIKVPLPSAPSGNAPTDYTVTAFGSAQTTETLTFLGGIDNTFTSELELAPMTELLLGSGEFVAPFLRDPNSLMDVYVSVNLLQWIITGATFSPLETFNIASGTSPLLPGFFVSTTPITLNGDGSLSGNPFTGTLFAAVAIDGGTVPEPSTVFMVATGVLAIFAFTYRNRGPGVV